MREKIEPGKRDWIIKSLKVSFRIFYYAMVLVGFLTCVVSGSIAFKVQAARQKLATCVPIDDPETVNSFVLRPSNDKPSDYLEPVGETFWKTIPNDGVSKTVVLARTDVTDDQLTNLENRSDVEIVYLVNCPNIADGAIERLARIPNLRRIVLDGCAGIKEPDFERLSCLRNLRRLSLQDCVNLTDKSVRTIATLRNLHILQLSGCSNLTPEGVLPLSSLPIGKFSAPECLLDDENIESILRFQKIEDLTIQSSRSNPKDLPLSDDGLLRLKGLDLLRFLRIRNCRNITEESVVSLTKHFVLNNFSMSISDSSLTIKSNKITDDHFLEVSSFN